MLEPFRGNLASYRLALLLPPLFQQQAATGTIHLWRGATRRSFELREGCVVMASSNDPFEHLAQVLADLRILDAKRAASAFAHAQATGQPLGAFLVERGFVELPRLQEALEYKAREGLFDCYSWESGEVELIPEVSKAPAGALIRLSLGPLHRDAVARLREWSAFRAVFPNDSLSFAVSDVSDRLPGDEDRELLRLAQQGASLTQLLGGREGRIHRARRLLSLHHRGALIPQGATANSAPEDLAILLRVAKACLEACDFAAAERALSEVLERAPVPEAHALYRAAEEGLFRQIHHAVCALEEDLVFAALPDEPPSELTADDLYLYSHLRSARSMREALRNSAMGEVAGYRSVQRLIRSGMVAHPSKEARSAG